MCVASNRGQVGSGQACWLACLGHGYAVCDSPRLALFSRSVLVGCQACSVPFLSPFPLLSPLTAPPSLQMNAGIILSYFNQRYFADTLSTLCEFIPQVGCGWAVGVKPLAVHYGSIRSSCVAGSLLLSMCPLGCGHVERWDATWPACDVASRRGKALLRLCGCWPAHAFCRCWETLLASPPALAACPFLLTRDVLAALTLPPSLPSLSLPPSPPHTFPDDLPQRSVWLPVHPHPAQVGHRLHSRPLPHTHLHVPQRELEAV